MFPRLVPLPFLACAHIASLTDSSKVAKIAGRHKIVSVSTKGRFPAVVNSRFFFFMGMPWRSPRLVVKWLDRLLPYSTCHHALPMLNHWLFSLSSFLKPLYTFTHVYLQAKNSNRTTVRTFWIFSLLCGCCMLLPFPSALTIMHSWFVHPPFLEIYGNLRTLINLYSEKWKYLIM